MPEHQREGDLDSVPEPAKDVEMDDNISDLGPDDTDFVVVPPHGTDCDSAPDTLALAPETDPDGQSPDPELTVETASGGPPDDAVESQADTADGGPEQTSNAASPEPKYDPDWKSKTGGTLQSIFEPKGSGKRIPPVWLNDEQHGYLLDKAHPGGHWVLTTDDFQPGGRAYEALSNMDDENARADFEDKIQKMRSEFEQSIKDRHKKDAEVATAALTEATTTTTTDQ